MYVLLHKLSNFNATKLLYFLVLAASEFITSLANWNI